MRARASLLLTFLTCCGGEGPPVAPPPAPSPTIGPAGGTLVAVGERARLVVPPGALAAEVALGLRASARGPVDAYVVGHSTFEVFPAATRFAVPATLTLVYSPEERPSGTRESELGVYALRGASWELLGGVADPTAHTLTATLGEAAILGARWRGPSAPCDLPEDRQFDFWVGSWSFHQGNLPPASNRISKRGGGCVIEESFQDPMGGQGRSVSLFSREDRKWHQTYVGEQGGRVALVGELEGTRMVLYETPSKRWIWDPIDADTVRYFGETSSGGGFAVTFDSTYRRR